MTSKSPNCKIDWKYLKYFQTSVLWLSQMGFSFEAKSLQFSSWVNKYLHHFSSAVVVEFSLLLPSLKVLPPNKSWKRESRRKISHFRPWNTLRSSSLNTQAFHHFPVSCSSTAAVHILKAIFSASMALNKKVSLSNCFKDRKVPSLVFMTNEGQNFLIGCAIARRFFAGVFL